MLILEGLMELSRPGYGNVRRSVNLRELALHTGCSEAMVAYNMKQAVKRGLAEPSMHKCNRALSDQPQMAWLPTQALIADWERNHPSARLRKGAWWKR